MKRVNAVTLRVDNMNLYQEAAATKSVEAVLKFMQSDYLKDKILNLDRSTLRGESKSSRVWKLDTNLELYNSLMQAKEETSSDVDYELDFEITRYYTFKRVVGYMIPFKPTIYVNSKYYDVASPEKRASNLIHEWIHTWGSRHFGRYLRESLAYFMNEWFEYWYVNFYLLDDTSEPEPIKYTTRCKRVWWKPWSWIKPICYKTVVRG